MKYLLDYQEGERVVAFCLVKSKEAGVASNQSEYLNLELGDRSGTISAKLWDVTPELKEEIQVKSVIKIDAAVQSYRGKSSWSSSGSGWRQHRMRCRWNLWCPSHPSLADELWDKLMKAVDSLKSDTLKTIVTEALSDPETAERLRAFPAGVRMHHQYYHGLLEHIVSLLSAAERLLRSIRRRIGMCWWRPAFSTISASCTSCPIRSLPNIQRPDN